MQLARVIGNVVATRKNALLEGAKLLLLQPLTGDKRPCSHPILAVDAAQAGVGETVLVVLEGRAAVSVLGRGAAPVDAAIVGVVDRVTLEEASRRPKRRESRRPARKAK